MEKRVRSQRKGSLKLDNEEPKRKSVVSRFAKFLIQPNVSGADGRKDGRDSSRSDMVTSAIEIGITPVVTFFIGFGIDHVTHTVPVFSIVGLFFGVAGVVLRIYYGLTDNSGSGIVRRVGDSTNIDSRSNTRLTSRSKSHSILSADLTVSDELANSANYLDGKDPESKADEE